jgi:hypothetical protein
MKIRNLTDDKVHSAHRILVRQPYMDRNGWIEQLEARIDALEETCGRLLEFMVESSLMTLDQAQTVISNYDMLEVYVEPEPPPPSPSQPQVLDDDIPF